MDETKHTYCLREDYYPHTKEYFKLAVSDGLDWKSTKFIKNMIKKMVEDEIIDKETIMEYLDIEEVNVTDDFYEKNVFELAPFEIREGI